MQDQKNLYAFLAIVCILIITGFIFIYSASSAFALEKCGSAHYFVKKQLIGALLGCVGLIVMRMLPFSLINRLSPVAFMVAFGLTLLTLISPLGRTINGSHRWLSLGGLSFQPSEFLKMSLIAYLAYLLAKKGPRLQSLIHGYLPLIALLAITSLVLLKQPDFGQTVTICVTAFMLFFIAQCSSKHLLSTAALLIPAGLVLIIMKPYRLKRILTFLNPWQDPQGAGFQIIQSLIAIGSGSFWGVGIAQSKQKFFYLPMQCTDFIFSIIAEETGLFGCMLLLGLFVAFLYFGIKVALAVKDDLFAYYLTLGFIFLNSLQAVINIFVATGLLPTKGLGLPFISYGNSALIANLCMVGIIVNGVKTKQESGVVHLERLRHLHNY